MSRVGSGLAWWELTTQCLAALRKYPRLQPMGCRSLTWFTKLGWSGASGSWQNSNTFSGSVGGKDTHLFLYLQPSFSCHSSCACQLSWKVQVLGTSLQWVICFLEQTLTIFFSYNIAKGTLQATLSTFKCPCFFSFSFCILKFILSIEICSSPDKASQGSLQR